MGFSRNDNKKQFVYKERSAESALERTNRNSDREGYINLPDVKWFVVKENAEHTIRPLPPFWNNAEHWGLDIWVHFGIGPDESTYLCLNKMKKGNCPICEEAAKAGDEATLQKFRANARVLQWIIDRDNEKAGPILWAPPKSFDTDLLSVATSKKNRSAIPVDNPDRGTDVFFKTEGHKPKMKYKSHKCEEASVLTTDVDNYNKWLTFAENNPLPKLLNFYNYDHIYTVFHGKSVNNESIDSKVTEKQSTDKEETTSSVTNVDKKSCSESIPHKFDYNYDQVMTATTDELDKILDDIMQHHTVDEKEVANMDDAGLKMYLCSLLKLLPNVVQPQEESESPATKLRNRFKRSTNVS